MYTNELKALKKVGRFRERKIFDDHLYDMASNDYLGLSSDKKQFKKAMKFVLKYKTLSPKASMLVNGYHPIHKEFEKTIAKLNGFEDAITVGSGYLANIALIESLVRKNDMLFIDEEYHASGVMASKLIDGNIITFKHNDVDNLRAKLKLYPANRQIVAVEGIYSMSGELCSREIFDLAEEKKTLLIVDEAHSSGVIGEQLLGIFDYYKIEINERHIKMGTLGKAYGSYGAYILASSHIVSYLSNRAKPIIYSTAPSVFDTALALVNIEYIRDNVDKFISKIKKRQKLVKKVLDIRCLGLIVPIGVSSNSKSISLQKYLIKQGYLVGAIRQPTVNSPIMRLILNTSVPLKKIDKTLTLISINKV